MTKIFRMGVPGIWLEWWDGRPKIPKQIRGELAGLLTEAFKDGMLHGMSRAGFQIDALYKEAEGEEIAPRHKPRSKSRKGDRA